ncbi:flagellar FlbD family protein [Silvanigrella aquatica]|uniref:Flagellar protein FlbD n=1 Tax=Silvanigrella aquatica TaxID=1915309 RepID=A0A1L4D0M0_9BACT|nr:flagellar FlbD family protein [Silvanigrella aquatica]APJ03762.1 hypothetical protein AXG55_07525 [Silvanigrella aquatica]
MIKLTRIDGNEVFINKSNIQWIEAMPDTTITILSGARIIVREKLDEVLKKIDDRIQYENKICQTGDELPMANYQEKFSSLPENL